jgi:hypothetical protein
MHAWRGMHRSVASLSKSIVQPPLDIYSVHAMFCPTFKAWRFQMNQKRAIGCGGLILVLGFLTYFGYERWRPAYVRITIAAPSSMCTASNYDPELVKANHDKAYWQPGAGISSTAQIHFPPNASPFASPDVHFGTWNPVVKTCPMPTYDCPYIVDGCSGFQQNIAVHVSH